MHTLWEKWCHWCITLLWTVLWSLSSGEWGTASGLALWRYIPEPSVDFAKWNVGYSKNVQYMILCPNRKLCKAKISHFHSVAHGMWGVLRQNTICWCIYISNEKRGIFTIRIPWLALLAGRQGRGGGPLSHHVECKMMEWQNEQNVSRGSFFFFLACNEWHGSEGEASTVKTYKFLIQWIRPNFIFCVYLCFSLPNLFIIRRCSSVNIFVTAYALSCEWVTRSRSFF